MCLLTRVGRGRPPPISKGTRHGRVAHASSRVAQSVALLDHLSPCAPAAHKLGVLQHACGVAKLAALSRHVCPRVEAAREAKLQHAPHRLLLLLLCCELALRLRLLVLRLRRLELRTQRMQRLVALRFGRRQPLGHLLLKLLLGSGARRGIGFALGRARRDVRVRRAVRRSWRRRSAQGVLLGVRGVDQIVVRTWRLAVLVVLTPLAVAVGE